MLCVEFRSMMSGWFFMHCMRCAMWQGDGASTSGSGQKVGIATVRGVKSFGMLCSAHDLGWSAEANGLAVTLPDSTRPGQALGDAPPEVRPSCAKCRSCLLGQAHQAHGIM